MKKIILYSCLILLSASCAQLAPLTGGKKDIDPPKALVFLPTNASLNFNVKQIEIQFDEFIAIKDITNQFIITPQTNELPEINADGKKLTIKFNENLLPNTTYKLAFGNAIVDMHEGNALQNFEYIFSTGNLIDSLIITGVVNNAINKKPMLNVLVGLYSANATDSVVYTNKPLYITKTTADGKFNFNYLPNKNFKLIAISDANKNLVYDGAEEQIAFLENTVNTNSTNDVELNLFKELPNKCFVKKSFVIEYGKALIVYNKPCIDITTVTLKNNEGSYHINELQDSVTVYYKNVFDTLNVIVNRSTKSDTLTLKTPSLIEYGKIKKNSQLKYVVNSNLTNSFPYYKIPAIELNIPFNITDIKKEHITCYKLTDSIKIKQAYQLTENEKQVNSFFINTTLQPETQYQIIIDNGAFSDSTGRINDSLNFKFKTTSAEDYAQLKLKLQLPKKENYLVRLLNDKEQLINESLVEVSLASTSEKIIEYNNLLPGNYFVNVVEDANKNKRFDTGNYFLKQQPETIFINKTPIKLLAGWEIESEWLVK